MQAYLSRIEKALHYIESNLERRFGVADVAAVAGYSPYHFHRLFTLIVGESVMAYVRRRRLTEAAADLRDGRGSVLDTALRWTFDSQEAFTRAFRSFAGTTPARFRREGRELSLRARPALTALTLDHRYGGITMKPRFVDLQAFHVVGMCGWFSKESLADIPRLWQLFIPRKSAIASRHGAETYGVCFCADPDQPDAGFFYLAAVPTEPGAEPPVDMVSKVVPAARYAVFTHKGKLDGLQETLRYIWGEWLPRSEYDPAGTPDFELYDERFELDSEESALDLYIPVVAAG